VRYSYQRETIKIILKGTNSHPTANWIYSQTKKIIPKISLGTVYRNLKQLDKDGKINTIYDGYIARYDWNIESHDHLKCTQCGDLVDIHLAHEKFKSIVQTKYKFDVDDIEMTIIGTCSKHVKK
tara:strand:- start:216 stop:587 length:372 start_codon:yes stop_codon:yes gene_type:complete